MFEGLVSLERLYLENNDISYIAAGAFCHMSKLQTLALADNNLTSLSTDIFYMTHDKKLGIKFELGINRNPLQCDRRLCWIKQAQKDEQISWHNVKEPDCTNYPDMDWNNITLDCPTIGERTQHSNLCFCSRILLCLLITIC